PSRPRAAARALPLRPGARELVLPRRRRLSGPSALPRGQAFAARAPCAAFALAVRFAASALSAVPFFASFESSFADFPSPPDRKSEERRVGRAAGATVA